MSERALPSQVLLDFSNRKLLSPVPRKLFKSAKLYFTNRELELLKTAYNVAYQANKEQTRAQLKGKINHNNFKNWNTSLSDKSSRIMMMNKLDEPEAVSYTHLTLPTNREV